MQVTFNPIISNNSQKRQTFGARLSGADLANKLFREVQDGYDSTNVAGRVAEYCLGGSLTKSQATDVLNRIKKITPTKFWDAIKNAKDVVNNA